MKKKAIRIMAAVLAGILLLCAVFFVTDYCRTLRLKTPVFAKASVLADDGGSGTYRGIFYRVAVEMCDTGSGAAIEEVTMHVGSRMVAASVAEQAYEEAIVEDWGLALTAKAVTADGMTVLFTQSGGKVKGELMTGEWFALEKKTDNGWEEVKPLPAEGEYAFNSIGYGIPSEGSFELPVLWNWMYGSLESGEYRIKKSVMDFVETGIYTEQKYALEFTVE